MRWRRGVLLAAIHLAVAVPIVSLQEVPYWHFLDASISANAKPSLRRVTFQDEQTITIDPCDWIWDGEISDPELVVQAANLPVVVVTGWHRPCDTRSRLTRWASKVYGTKTRQADIASIVCLAMLIGFQWVIVGGFPLRSPCRWWAEPGIFITLCTVGGVGILLVPAFDRLGSRIVALLMIGSWFWWLGLLVTRAGKWTWQSTLGRGVRLTG